jgi:NAD(P)-dependent dehydrogenase (short-subunit alcohol dehydrogenase family)
MAWSLADIASLAGRTAVVTGANGGLGYQTARVLAQRGAHVVMAARSSERAAKAREQILAEAPGASLEVAVLDLASLDSVRAAGDAIAAAHPVVDILVNSAGVMAIPYRTTADGHEMQLGVNHLGHVALTARLLPSLLSASAGRIVWLTSTGRFMGPSLDAADPSLERDYTAWAAYGRSKRAALQVAVELNGRLVAAGTRARSMAADPGFANTDLQARSVREEPGIGQRFFHWFVRTAGSTPLHGAMPQLRAATDPNLPGGTLVALRLIMRGSPSPSRLLGPGLDHATRRRVFEASQDLVGERLGVGDPHAA